MFFVTGISDRGLQFFNEIYIKDNIQIIDHKDKNDAT